MFSFYCCYLNLSKLRNLTSFRGDVFLQTDTGLPFVTEVCWSLKVVIGNHSNVAEKATVQSLHLRVPKVRSRDAGTTEGQGGQ